MLRMNIVGKTTEFNLSQLFNDSGAFNVNDVSYLYYKNPEEMRLPWMANPYFFPTIITIAVTFVIGVTGNVAVIWFMAGDRNNQSVTSIFLVSLAVSDLLLLTIYAPLEMAHYFVAQFDRALNICHLSKYAECVSGFASILNLLAVTLERFVVIVFPIQSRSICTMRNCKRLMYLVWILSLLLSTPVLWCMEVTKTTFYNQQTTLNYYRCEELTTWEGEYYRYYRLVCLFVSPSIIMGFCYAWVIRELWISTKTMNELTNHITPQRRESKSSISKDTCSSPCNHKIILRSHVSQESRDVKTARQQVIKMLILVVVLFLLCWGPRVVYEVVIKCCLGSYDNFAFLLRVLFYLLPFIHSCLNPIVYCFMSTKFRRKVMPSFGRLCSRARVDHMEFSSKMETSINGHVSSVHNLPSINTSFDTAITRTVQNSVFT